MRAGARFELPARGLKHRAQLSDRRLGIGGINHVLQIDPAEVIDASSQGRGQGRQGPEVGRRLQVHLLRQEGPGIGDQLQQITLLGFAQNNR